jgi:hypothetical protein
MPKTTAKNAKLIFFINALPWFFFDPKTQIAASKVRNARLLAATNFVGDEVTRLILISDWGLRMADFQFETPHVVTYGFGMGSAPVPVAVFGVAPASPENSPAIHGWELDAPIVQSPASNETSLRTATKFSAVPRGTISFD